MHIYTHLMYVCNAMKANVYPTRTFLEGWPPWQEGNHAHCVCTTKFIFFEAYQMIKSDSEILHRHGSDTDKLYFTILSQFIRWFSLMFQSDSESYICMTQTMTKFFWQEENHAHCMCKAKFIFFTTHMSDSESYIDKWQGSPWGRFSVRKKTVIMQRRVPVCVLCEDYCHSFSSSCKYIMVAHFTCIYTHHAFPVSTHHAFPVSTHHAFPVSTHHAFPASTHYAFPASTHHAFSVSTLWRRPIHMRIYASYMNA